MNRNQLENIYLTNGLKDFRLRTTEDLFKVHGIDYKIIDGYNRLDDLNRAIYEKFIINFFNAQGLDYRNIIPKGIYWVEDSNYLVRENPNQDYYTVSGGIVIAIDRNGLRCPIMEWKDEDYNNLERIVEKPTTYLRFEYEHDGRNEWLHIIKEGKEWY